MSIWMLACPLMMGCIPGFAWLAARLGRSPAGRTVRSRCMSAIRGTTALPTANTDGAAHDA
jgi:hypothetical protein